MLIMKKIDAPLSGTAFGHNKAGDSAYALSGALTGEVLKPFLAQMPTEQTCTLDFTKVGSINFSGIRALLNAREAGKRFVISGASRRVAELFEATGASKFISVCRAPEALDMSQWVKSGEGHTAESFDHVDGDAMMKLYFDHIPFAAVEQETRTAQAAFLMGIPTPMPGEMIRCGDRFGTTCERLKNNRSFSRIISDEPERLEELVVRLAKMAKKLHATPCDKAVFPSYHEKMAQIIRSLPVFTAEEKQTFLGFLNSVEDTGMCIHGDLNISNVITDGTVDLFIDMGDFSYGNPLFDLGAIYYLSHDVYAPDCLKNYHNPKERMAKLWAPFAREYFGADTPEKQAKIEETVRPYAAFQMMIFLRNTDCKQPVAAGLAREYMKLI